MAREFSTPQDSQTDDMQIYKVEWFLLFFFCFALCGVIEIIFNFKLLLDADIQMVLYLLSLGVGGGYNAEIRS